MSTEQTSDRGIEPDKASDLVTMSSSNDEQQQDQQTSSSLSIDENEETSQTKQPSLSPSISMSAGADPWADPSAYAPHVNEMRKPGRDNPWATNSPITESVDDDHTLQRGQRTGVSALHTSFDPTDDAKAQSIDTSTAMTNAQALSNGGGQQAEATQDEKGDVKYTLVKDDRQGAYDLPKLGKSALRYWQFKSGLVNLNNGSFGACPKPVLDAVKQLEDQQEENPDMFRYQKIGKLLAEQRSRVAAILSCEPDELSFIPNSTTGTNAVLRDLVYSSGDAILCLSSTYGAIFKNIDYLIETEKMRGVELTRIDVPITFPTMSVQDILNAFEQAIIQAQKDKKRIRIGVVDTIVSRPGTRLPWEALVKVLQKYRILSMVDGAHGIGQIPINLSQVQPDFFVSNCHKWFYAHRGCAVFYVPKRNKHIQRSSLPTSWFYTSNPTAEDNSWAQQWEGPGTDDMASRLSVNAAMDFRESLGGEARIMNYNHDLAVRGGRAAARILGTEVMDDEHNTFTASMANVRLPIVIAAAVQSKNGMQDTPAIEGADGVATSQSLPAQQDTSSKSYNTSSGSMMTNEALDIWSAKATPWFVDRLMSEFKILAPIYIHDNKVWVRFSAQAWLDVDDFEYAARALLDLCKRINAGQVPELKM